MEIPIWILIVIGLIIIYLIARNISVSKELTDEKSKRLGVEGELRSAKDINKKLEGDIASRDRQIEHLNNESTGRLMSYQSSEAGRKNLELRLQKADYIIKNELSILSFSFHCFILFPTSIPRPAPRLCPDAGRPFFPAGERIPIVRPAPGAAPQPASMISEFDNKKSRRRDRRLVQYNTSKRVAYCPVTEYDSRAFISFVKYLSAQDKTITIPSVGQTVSLGSAKVTFVGPVDMTLAEQNENNASLIVRIEYGQTSFLFTGDAEIEEELSVVHSEQIIQSTLLKVGHHGSYTSSSEEFLKAVSPKYAIISVGKDNGYGHPHEEAMNRIQQYCDTVLRTDVVGEIPFRQIVFAIRYSIHFPAGFFKVRSAAVFGRNTNQAFSFICVSSQQRLSDKRERITAHTSKH